MASVTLLAGREKSVLRRHPWIFSGAIASIAGEPAAGETVEVLAADGTRCGCGAYSPHSQIAVRMWTFDPDEEVGPPFLRGRLARALESRRPPQSAWSAECGRLVHSEADGLPGVIIDRYAGFLVCQFLSAGAEYWKPTVVSLLCELAPGAAVYERSDAAVREKERLPESAGVLAGEAPPDAVEVREGPARFLVDIQHGQKTGFYLDQRDNRARAARYLAGGEVLDCFSYTGSFTVVALMAGAAGVTTVDSSADALAMAARNIQLNGLDVSKVRIEEGNAFALLRRYRDSRRQFDAVILDPPKFIEARSHIEGGSRGYKDINLLGMKLLRPGGVLISFSCSQHMSQELFQRILAFAALDARRDVQILERLQQAPDHPMPVNFPESGYLKGVICRVW